MFEACVRIAYAVAAVIHLLPALGLLGPAWLARLYALDLAEPNLLVLMRHRALLFGVVGGLLAAAVWRPSWRLPAGLAGVASMAGYLVLAGFHSPLTAALLRVARVDWFALAVLVPAVVLVAARGTLRG